MSQVRVQNLFKSYDTRPILERIDLDVASGSFVTLVGASGCGKSTFLRMLLGQEEPSKGSILVDGEPLPPEPDPNRGIVFQRYSVYPHLNVVENVMLGLEFQGSPFLGRLFGASRRRAMETADRLVEAVGLSHVRTAMPAALSGGMQQRLAIAQALALRPKIMLLDEPFGALDPGIRTDMHSLMRRLWRETGMTVFMVTHDIREAFALGTRVLTFDKVRHDPQEPDAYGATITYDLKGGNAPLMTQQEDSNAEPAQAP
ncbi:MAG: ABC transporter ATP-binding protein [Pseudomonadota bacterium]